MGSTLADVTYLWRRPGPLRLVSGHVCVGSAGGISPRQGPSADGRRQGGVACLRGIGRDALLPRKLRRFGGDAYVFSLVVTSSLLAIVVVPTWVAPLGWTFRRVQVTTALGGGGGYCEGIPHPVGRRDGRQDAPAEDQRETRRSPARGRRSCSVLVRACDSRHALGLDVRSRRVGDDHARGPDAARDCHRTRAGTDPDDRTGLAIACATRHIGVAVLVATSFPGPRTAVLIAVYIVASAVVSIPYLRWRQKPSASEGSESCES